MVDCNCDLCEAGRLGCHPWELLWGKDSIESRLLREKPGFPIHYYEAAAQHEIRSGAWTREGWRLSAILDEMGIEENI